MIGELRYASRRPQAQSATTGIHEMRTQRVVIEVAPRRSSRPRHPGEHHGRLDLAGRSRINISEQRQLPLDQVAPFGALGEHRRDTGIGGKHRHESRLRTASAA